MSFEPRKVGGQRPGRACLYWPSGMEGASARRAVGDDAETDGGDFPRLAANGTGSKHADDRRNTSELAALGHQRATLYLAEERGSLYIGDRFWSSLRREVCAPVTCPFLFSPERCRWK